MWTLRGLLIVAFLACCEYRSACAVVVYSEDFEGMTVDTAVPVDPGNIGLGFVVANGAGTDTSKMIVRNPSSPEGNGLTTANAAWSGNKFGEWHDNTIGSPSGLLIAQFAPLTATPVKISFDYYEPSGFPAENGDVFGNGNILAFVTGNSNNIATTSNRSINLIFGDPQPGTSEQFQTNPPASAGTLDNYAPLNTKHTLEFFANLGTGDTLTYKAGVESVANNTYDVWLNGTRVFDDVGLRNVATVTTWSRLGFTIGTAAGGTDVKYFDNIVVRSDFGEAVPLAGDYNSDGKVDAADYTLWRKNPGSFGGDPAGYNTWRENFGKPTGAGLGTGAVPEPSAIAFCGLAIAAAIARWRRK
jgi:hypothetical protein